MKLSLFPIIAIIFFSCNNGQVQTKDNSFQDYSFQAYYEKIPTTKLPLTIICGLEYFSPADSLFSDSILKKYRPRVDQGMQIYGRIFPDEKNIYILYWIQSDIRYPWLYTYDRQGAILDSLYLHISSCASDATFEMMTESIIRQDKTIQMTDTIKHFRIDIIEGKRVYDFTTLRNQTYKLDSLGIPKLFYQKADTLNGT